MSMRCALGMLAIAWLAGATAVQAQALRDPTRPPGTAAAKNLSGGVETPKGDLRLQSILVSPERRAAIISGQVVQLGESVQGYRVVAIGDGEAVLRMGGQSRTLRLFPAVDLRQPAAAAEGPSAGRAGDAAEEGAAGAPADGG